MVGKLLLLATSALMLVAFLQIHFNSKVAMKVNRKGDLVTVSLTNNDAKSIRIWDHGNIWGDLQFRFIFQNQNGETLVARRDGAVYTVNSPEVGEIVPSETCSYKFDLSDGTWLRPKLADCRLIAVILSIEINDEALKNGLLLERIVCQM